MRVGIDGRSLLEKYPSGVSKYTEGMIQALAQQPGEHLFYIWINSRKLNRSLSGWDKFSNVKIITTRFPSKFIASANFLSNRPLINNMIRENIDVWWLPANNFYSWNKQLPVVITCHDLSWLSLPEYFSFKSRCWHWATHLERKYKTADKLVAVSEFTKKEITRLIPEIASDKIQVICPAVNFPFISDSQATVVRDKYDLPEKYILYIGNIESRKNLETLILAFKKIVKDFKDIHLVVAGGGGWDKKYYKIIVQQLKQNTNCHYLGYVSESDKWSLYKLATIFAFPSVYEGFGFPPLEAMSQNCPVVASSSSSLPEIVGAGAYLANPYNIQEWVYALSKLLADENERLHLAEKGKKLSESFAWDESASKLILLFNNITEK